MKKLLPISLAFWAFLSDPVNARVLTVCPGGSCDYSTITAALAAATDGDTIRVAPGIYSTASGEVFPLTVGHDSITLEWLTNGVQPHLQGDQQHTVVLIEAGGVTLRGFHITDGQGSEGINMMDGGGVCVFVGPSETNAVTIRDCLIENNTCPSDETYDGCGGGIYCGGTYCTCFEIRIADCVIRQNSVRGDGGGVFCALLSNVKIEDTLIEENLADDHGGGIFVDVYAAAALTNIRLLSNNCPGDPQKANWGGKGGGLACESYGLFTATNCVFAQNTARYFGGGIFTRGGLFTGEGLCGEGAQFPQVASSLITSNRAEVSGGGAYVASSGVLEFSATTNYWNEAAQDGGGIYVAGTGSDGGQIQFSGHCLLEGNECAGRGGGVFLGPASRATVADTRFLGNFSLYDGGALLLNAAATATFTNCLVTYNNAARGHGGGFRLLSGANAKLARCSVVGNFATFGRSGLVLSTNAMVAITNSILWRNAGGSVETNGGTVQVACSLIDTPDPGFVGWGTKSNLYVNSAVAGPGTGIVADPYRDLQIGLDGFDFRLATNSPCIRTACDRGNMGAETGVGGTPGNITATLCLTNGLYDIRGRNIIFTRGMLGAGATNSLIRHAVFGYVEDTFIRDLGITAEEIFGGIVIRANVRFENCRVAGNTAGTSIAGADGGGIYVAEGHCRLTNSVVSVNKSWGNGGGLFLGTNVLLTVAAQSQILQNGATGRGGGCFASSMTTNSVTEESIIAENSSTGNGAGLFLDVSSVSLIADSQISTNSALNSGGGICVDGWLTVTNVDIWRNTVSGGENRGGGVYINRDGNVSVLSSVLRTNYSGYTGGGIDCRGKMDIDDSSFESNVSGYGGAICIGEEPAGSSFCHSSRFSKNLATGWGGALYVWVNTAPFFLNCQFVENSAHEGGAAMCWDASRGVFENCRFSGNKCFGGDGGCLYLISTSTRFRECTFGSNSAMYDGGTVFMRGADASLFEDCAISQSAAGRNGGALMVSASAQPVLSRVQIVDSRATNNGGGIAVFASARPVFSDLTISNAQAVLGGGVYAEGTTTNTFERCRFYGNTATSSTVSADGGGGCFTANAVARFSCCRFAGNQALDDGGGLSANGSASVSLTNTFIVSNSAANTGGGAHFTANSSGFLQNCTLVGNSASPSHGGGIYSDEASFVIIDSSIVYGNYFDGIQGSNHVAAVYSCLQEVWPGTGNITDNPLLDPLTLFLADGSPCIDAGNPWHGLNDACSPPGKGTARNDMGASGGPRNCGVLPVVPAWFVVSAGPWRYSDRGQEPGGNWRAADYDDSGWSYGLAKFGYGGDGEVTTVNFGTNSEQKFISTYFRRSFTVTNAAAITNLLELRLICDDGAVVYLNGVEAVRYNMPTSAVSYGTLASSDIVGADENRWISFQLSPSLLTEGANVVAVEVHQVAANSGDLGFDLQLATHDSFTILPGPKTIYVNDDSTNDDVFTSGVGDDSNTGLNPGFPLRHFSTVFARYSLEPGDVIYLDNGLYTNESVTVPSSAKGFTVLGAGMDRSLIDGGSNAPCLVLNQVQGVTLKDLCLQHGKATNDISDFWGGALLSTRSDVLLERVALRDSTAQYGGGAFFDQSDVFIRDSIASGNLATNAGGGAYLYWATTAGARHVVTNCVMTNNQAYIGGGLSVDDGLVQACTMVGNTASHYGGGAALWNRSRIEGCLVTANRANYSAGLDLSHMVAGRDCIVTSNTASIDGGGLRMWSSTPLSNCVFVGNVATNTGGGANLWGSAMVRNCTFAANRANFAGGLTLDGNARGQDCTITNNTASIDGGGAFLVASATLSNCTLAGNSATNWGGGAKMIGESRLESCLIRSNHAKWAGGLNLGGTALARDCVISNNTANADGGGANLWDSTTLSNCTIAANSAVNDSGGGVYCNGNGLLQNCRVLDNTATGSSGGGVYIINGGKVRNSLMSGNTGINGGGLYLSAGTAESCTIASNTAAVGGGLYIESGAVTNTIIYFNQAINGPNYCNNSPNCIYSHCCTTPDITNGIVIITNDPGFLNWPAGDFRLATCSPCIERGINSSWMIGASDLEGKPRILGGVVDLGAYEYFPLDTDGDGLPDWWECRYFQSTTGALPAVDFDGDGLSNLAEFIAGTDPTNRFDFFKIAEVYLDPATSRPVISWDATPGRFYTVYAASELPRPWTNTVYQVAPADKSRQRYTNDVNTGVRFFRVGVRLQN